MNLAQLNAKIDALPRWWNGKPDQLCRDEARHLRDERLGHLGVLAGQEPTEAQVDLVHAQLWPDEAQGNLL